MSVFSGRCACGAVTWRAEGPTTRNLVCYCESCRRATSSGFTAFLGFGAARLTWKGPVRAFESSEGTDRGFCERCGTRLYFRSHLFADETHVHAATLDDPEQYRPDAQVWVSESCDWVPVTENLAQHQGFQRDPASNQRGEETC